MSDSVGEYLLTSVAVAKVDVFRKNGISVGNIYAKIPKIFDNIDHIKICGVV